MTRPQNVIVFTHYPKPTSKFTPSSCSSSSSLFPLPTIKIPISLSILVSDTQRAKEKKKPTMAATTLFLIVLLSICTVSVLSASHHHAAAPAPSVDCSTLILNMADCLSFVSSGSTDAKPEGSCCSGLKKVLKTDAECLCEAFKSSASLGVTLNITKASTLPAACKLHAPSIANCGLSVAPASAPGLAPGGAAAGPESAGALAPNPSPGNDGSSLIPIRITTVFSTILFVLFSSM